MSSSDFKNTDVSIAPERHKVIEGLNEWLFLGNDSNDSVGQFTGTVFLGEQKLNALDQYLGQVKDKVECPLFFSIAPNKEFVLPENYPFCLAQSNSGNMLVHQSVIEVLKSRGISFDYPVEFLSSLENSYYKTDTHWSDFGAYSALCHMFSEFSSVEICSLSENDFQFEYVAGDLGSKLDGRKDSRLSYVADVSCYEIFNSGMKNHGHVAHYVNPNALNEGSVLVFGDSFGIGYIKALVLTFREVIFVYSPATFIEDVYLAMKPDFLILQINQRFLIEPPVYRTSFSKSLVLKKLAKYSPEELFEYYLKLMRYETSSFLSAMFIDNILCMVRNGLLPSFQRKHLLYSTPNIDLVADYSDLVMQCLTITFTARSDALQTSGFGESFFDKRKLPAIYFISKKNHWWNVPEMADIIRKIQPILCGANKVVTYGASMGAHGALIFSSSLNADVVIAGSPQYAINGRLVPWQKRWIQDTKDIKEIFPIEAGISKTAKVVCLYDAFNSFDKKHIEYISYLTDIDRVTTSFSGHTSILHLRDIGLLGDFFDVVALEKSTLKEFIAVYKKRRRTNLKYWLGIMMLSYKRTSRRRLYECSIRNSIDIVMKFLENKHDLAPHNDINFFIKKHYRSFISMGLVESAVQLATKYTVCYPEVASSHDVLSNIYWKAGLYEEALLESRRALRLNRKNSSLRISVARLQVKLSIDSEALYNIDAALGYPSKDLKSWIALYRDISGVNFFGAVLPRVKEKILHLSPGFDDF